MTQCHRSNDSATPRWPRRLLMSAFLVCAVGTGLLWLLEPPEVQLPAELEALQPAELDVQMTFPTEAEMTEAEEVESDDQVETTGLISATESSEQSKAEDTSSDEDTGTIYWAFPGKGSEGPVLHLPGLVKLPAPAGVAQEDSKSGQMQQGLEILMPKADIAEHDGLEDDQALEDEPNWEGPVAILMPPTEVPESDTLADAATSEFIESEAVSNPDESENTTPEDLAYEAPITPTPRDLTDLEQKLIDQVMRETSQSVTGALTDTRLNEVAKQKIHQANAMARRGTPFAARQKLIEVLRMVSQAKDARAQNPEYSAALASGLRALQEAEDFLPQAAQLEADLDLALVIGAHRTPLAKHIDLADAMPQQMLDRYLRYAQLKMAMAVAGDPAGSMALYALGKVSSQMGEFDLPRQELAHREAVAYQQAALLAHNQNHYAAHELAVLLARSGHYGSAHHLLQQVAARQPNPMVLRNLARVQQRLGMNAQARATYDRAGTLAAAGGSKLIDWVPPEKFARSTQTVQQPSKQSIARQPNHTIRR